MLRDPTPHFAQLPAAPRARLSVRVARLHRQRARVSPIARPQRLRQPEADVRELDAVARILVADGERSLERRPRARPRTVTELDAPEPEQRRYDLRILGAVRGLDDGQRAHETVERRVRLVEA